jgi:transcriptional regulator with XRE-family HTH domain
MIRESIKKELKKRRWKIKHFAELCNIRYGTISQYLNGTKECRSDIMEVMFKTLGWVEINPDEVKLKYIQELENV